MKDKNLRIQKLCDAGTEKLYKWWYCTISMATSWSSENPKKLLFN